MCLSQGAINTLLVKPTKRPHTFVQNCIQYIRSVLFTNDICTFEIHDTSTEVLCIRIKYSKKVEEVEEERKKETICICLFWRMIFGCYLVLCAPMAHIKFEEKRHFSLLPDLKKKKNEPT